MSKRIVVVMDTDQDKKEFLDRCLKNGWTYTYIVKKLIREWMKKKEK